MRFWRLQQELSTRPKGRRRIIYVISDGKEAGSKARTYRDMLRHLQTNDVAVWGTLVATRRGGAKAAASVSVPDV